MHGLLADREIVEFGPKFAQGNLAAVNDHLSVSDLICRIWTYGYIAMLCRMLHADRTSRINDQDP